MPSSRRLYSFASQHVLLEALTRSKSWKKGDQLPKGITEEYLIIWAFESWLKDQYFEMLQTLEVWCNDELDFAKSRAMSYVYELLKEKPEQESNLLRLLVNKLGDPVKKIASQASYLLMPIANSPSSYEADPWSQLLRLTSYFDLDRACMGSTMRLSP